MSASVTVMQCMNAFFMALQDAKSLTYHCGAKVTPSYREKFCIIDCRTRTNLNVDIFDLPTSTETEAWKFCSNKLNEAEENGIQDSGGVGTNLYNSLVDLVLYPTERSLKVAEQYEPTPEECAAIYQFIHQQLKGLGLEDRFDFACTLADEGVSLFHGKLTNADAVMQPLFREHVLPTLREVRTLFEQESSRCKLDVEAQKTRDEILARMNELINKMSKVLVTSEDISWQRFVAKAGVAWGVGL